MPWSRRLLRLLVVAAFGGLTGALALQLWGVEGRAGPGIVRLGARVDVDPRTELLIPPLGSISAATHTSPITLSARVEQVDVAALEELIGSRPAEERLRADIESDLSSLARSLFVRCLLVAAAAGAISGAVVPHRRWATVAAGGAGGLVVSSALLWSAWTGFDGTAFDEPQFEGPLKNAPQVIATARQYVDDFDAVRDRISALSAQIGDLYATSLTDEIAAGPGRRRILHVSDIHLNPVGVEVTRELAEQFDVQAILDTGDITSFGNSLESQFGRLIEDIGVPYYLVPGNHDSGANRVALGQFPNVTIVDGQVVDIAGVRVLGVAHPVFTADNQTPEEEIEVAVAAQSERTARLVRRVQPDLLAVHDPAQAADSTGDVPVVVAGHIHQRSWEEVDGTLVLTVGTTGATGLGAFTVDTSLAYEAAVLYFDGPDLIAVDNVALRGTNGEFRIDRRLAPEPETDADSDADESGAGASALVVGLGRLARVGGLVAVHVGHGRPLYPRAVSGSRGTSPGRRGATAR